MLRKMNISWMENISRMYERVLHRIRIFIIRHFYLSSLEFDRRTFLNGSLFPHLLSLWWFTSFQEDRSHESAGKCRILSF